MLEGDSYHRYLKLGRSQLLEVILNWNLEVNAGIYSLSERGDEIAVKVRADLVTVRRDVPKMEFLHRAVVPWLRVGAPDGGAQGAVGANSVGSAGLKCRRARRQRVQCVQG